LIDQLGEAEVGDERAEVERALVAIQIVVFSEFVTQEDVGRFDIAVQHVLRMNVRDRLGELHVAV